MDDFEEDKMLKQIKLIKILLVCIFACVLTMSAALVTVTVYILVESEDCIEEDDLSGTTGDLIYEGKYDEAIELSLPHLEKYPNAKYVLWNLALAYYHKEEWEKSLEVLDKLEDIVPNWKEGWIEPYKNSIHKKMQEQYK